MFVPEGRLLCARQAGQSMQGKKCQEEQGGCGECAEEQGDVAGGAGRRGAVRYQNRSGSGQYASRQ